VRQRDQIIATHEAVAERDGTCILRGLGECLGRGEMNEHPSRAKTRGLPPEQRFNRAICHMLCVKHHRVGAANFTAGTLKLEPVDPVEGFEGWIIATFPDGRVVVIDRARRIHYIRSANGT
jgi:hypothetical protein